MKRTTYLLLTVAVVVVLFVFGYWFRYQGGLVVDLSQSSSTTGSLPSTSNNFPSNNPPPVTITIPSSGGETPVLGLVAQSPVESYFIDSQNNAVIVQPDGQIVGINANQPTTLSSQNISSLRKASFSYNGQKILAVFGGASNPQVSVFDVLSRAWQPSIFHFTDASWSPSDYRVAYFSKTTTSSALTIVDLNDPKAKIQSIVTFRAEDVRAQWLNQNQMLFSEPPSGLTQTSLWNYDLKQKLFSPILVDQTGLDLIWNSSTNQGLIFKTSSSGRGGSLVLVDSAGKTVRTINLTSLPSKCAFNTVPVAAPINTSSSSASSSPTTQGTVLQSSLICGVPRDDSEFRSEVLPDAYYQNAFFTADDFYGINLVTGGVQKLFSPPQAMDATDLRIVNGILFFINRLDSRLYALSLPSSQ